MTERGQFSRGRRVVLIPGRSFGRSFGFTFSGTARGGLSGHRTLARVLYALLVWA